MNYMIKYNTTANDNTNYIDYEPRFDYMINSMILYCLWYMIYYMMDLDDTLDELVDYIINL